MNKDCYPKKQYIILPMSPKKSFSPGYSLVELLLVLSLLSIISLIVFPTLVKFNERRLLEGQARLMATELRLAAHTAMTTKKEHRILFLNERAYQILCPQQIRIVRLPEGITMANNFPLRPGSIVVRILIFYESGVPNQGGTICLTNRFGENMYIIVGAATGRIRVSHFPPAS